MREGREKGTDGENLVPQKTQKRCSIVKKCLLHIENSKNTTFSREKKVANCETPFPFFFFEKFVRKRPFRV